jgi:hypothetical protein
MSTTSSLWALRESIQDALDLPMGLHVVLNARENSRSALVNGGG